jgi:hypothetical protein
MNIYFSFYYISIIYLLYIVYICIIILFPTLRCCSIKGLKELSFPDQGIVIVW